MLDVLPAFFLPLVAPESDAGGEGVSLPAAYAFVSRIGPEATAIENIASMATFIADFFIHLSRVDWRSNRYTAKTNLRSAEIFPELYAVFTPRSVHYTGGKVTALVQRIHHL